MQSTRLPRPVLVDESAASCDVPATCILQLERQQGVAEIRLNAPRCNAIGQALLRRLEEVVDELQRDPPAVVVLSSAHARGFCQGDDLIEAHERVVGRDSRAHRWVDRVTRRVLGRAKTPLDPVLDALAIQRFLGRVNAVLNRLERLPCPVVAVVHGVCLGGGWELAAACDLIVAEKSARFGLPELRLATLPAFGAVPRLEKELSAALLRDLLLSGRTVSAKRLQELGVLHQVVPDGKGRSVALRLAARLEALDPEVVRHTKAFVKPTPRGRLLEERLRVLLLTARPAFRAALKAFADGPSRPFSYL